ncbi:MAG: bifunctional folylpolyglutamate synthase/dihydrofolate synthase [Alistipes sp.]|nr:bifunctional folylpolyglutamate synthase/dihydrofolate synthase [Alistipes sp.]
MNYTQTLDFLYSSLTSFQEKGASAYKPGLERITAFCRHLGNPQRNFFTVHVAGTNGKGSVSHILASVLQQAGYRTGLYTSPHLTDFRERIRVDGEMIPKQKVVNFVDKHVEKMKELELSFFEMSTAMAFDFFAQSDVEVAIIETGLGGRLDATNIVVPILSIITNVDRDHTQLLGESLKEIAREKAGIIKKSIPVMVGEHNPECDPVFEEVAGAMKSRLLYAEEIFSCENHRVDETLQRFSLVRKRDGQPIDVESDLMGAYQRQNIITASAAADFLHEETPLTISRRAFREGTRTAAANTSLRGRWQQIGQNPRVICDTGHNEAGIRRVAEQLSAQTYERLYCVVGFVKDKEVDTMLACLPKEACYLFSQAHSERALPAVELAERAAAHGLQGEVIPSVGEALARACTMASEQDLIFVGGSNYVVAEVL